MGYGQPIAAGARYENIGVTSASGTTVTAGTANVYGSLATLGTTSFAYDGIILNVNGFSSSGRYRFTLTANNGAADQAIVSDIMFEPSTRAPIS